ncbi:MAG: hypothetical protein GZ088_09755 [Acidipila sp.]|nr:hypothetical protein [Acidipila sp.]
MGPVAYGPEAPGETLPGWSSPGAYNSMPIVPIVSGIAAVLGVGGTLLAANAQQKLAAQQVQQQRLAVQAAAKLQNEQAAYQAQQQQYSTEVYTLIGIGGVAAVVSLLFLYNALKKK